MGCKRVRFGLQKESFWRVKGFVLESKRGPFEKQGNLACFFILSKYKQMLILFINPLLLRLYIRKPKE